MNTIEEILKKKRQECKNCSNRYNTLDLCNVVVNIENKAQCVNYAQCMQNKCKTCKNMEKCNV